MAVLYQEVGLGLVQQLLVQPDVALPAAAVDLHAVQAGVDQELDIALEILLPEKDPRFAMRRQ